MKQRKKCVWTVSNVHVFAFQYTHAHARIVFILTFSNKAEKTIPREHIFLFQPKSRETHTKWNKINIHWNIHKSVCVRSEKRTEREGRTHEKMCVYFMHTIIYDECVYFLWCHENTLKITRTTRVLFIILWMQLPFRMAFGFLVISTIHFDGKETPCQVYQINDT